MFMTALYYELHPLLEEERGMESLEIKNIVRS